MQLLLTCCIMYCINSSGSCQLAIVHHQPIYILKVSWSSPRSYWWMSRPRKILRLTGAYTRRLPDTPADGWQEMLWRYKANRREMVTAVKNGRLACRDRFADFRLGAGVQRDRPFRRRTMSVRFIAVCLATLMPAECFAYMLVTNEKPLRPAIRYVIWKNQSWQTGGKTECIVTVPRTSATNVISLTPAYYLQAFVLWIKDSKQIVTKPKRRIPQVSLRQYGWPMMQPILNRR